MENPMLPDPNMIPADPSMMGLPPLPPEAGMPMDPMMGGPVDPMMGGPMPPAFPSTDPMALAQALAELMDRDHAELSAQQDAALPQAMAAFQQMSGGGLPPVPEMGPPTLTDMPLPTDELE